MAGHENHDRHDHLACSDMKHYTNTELIVSNDILAKAKELAQLISDSSEVQFFQKAEAQISSNDHVQTIISAIKKKQKEIVAFESFQNKKMIEKIEKEIEELQEQLDAVPIVNEFRQSQEDINYLLQLVMSVIRDTVSEKITVEDGKAE